MKRLVIRSSLTLSAALTLNACSTIWVPNVSSNDVSMAAPYVAAIVAVETLSGEDHQSETHYQSCKKLPQSEVKACEAQVEQMAESFKQKK